MKEQAMIKWTGDVESLRYHAAFNFITTLATRMQKLNITQRELANRLGVSESRISRIFNNHGNLTLAKMIELAKVVNHKIAVVPYDDEDPDFEKAPVIADVFVELWQLHARPHNFDEIQSISRHGESRDNQ
jgi:transcriptional regulator with XRE-family HTH domain